MAVSDGNELDNKKQSADEDASPNGRKECLKIKREKNFKFIWTQYGRIYLRKDANSPAKTVANQKDLELVRRSAAS